jgi:hypothetical protein
MKRFLILAAMVCGLATVGSSASDAGWRNRGGWYGGYSPYYGSYYGGYGYSPYRSYYRGYGYYPYRSYYGGGWGWGGGRRGGVYIRW